MNYSALLTYFAARVDEMLQGIESLVKQETPSHDKARLDAFAAYLAKRYSATGASVEVLEVAEHGNHLRITFGHDAFSPATAPALLLCHYDTVWPMGTLERLPYRVEAGRAYGPGIFDMQSSLILAEFAFCAIRDLALPLTRPITLLVTSDEEIGSHSSRALIEEEARRSAYVLVLESPLPGGVLKTSRKGVGSYTMHITGRAAHAGVEPEKGISAVQELAHQVLQLHALTDWEQGTTVNVGVVQAGTAANVVAAQAVAEVDVRVWTQAEADRIDAALSQLQPLLPGAQVKFKGGWNRPPLERRVTEGLYVQARQIGLGLGLDLGEGGTGGGSDGNFTGALGAPTLDGLGVPGHGAHADHEHIEVDKIADRAALLVVLLLELQPPTGA